MNTTYDTFSPFIDKNALDSDNDSDDGLGDIEDLIKLPELTSVRPASHNKFFQYNLPIENGVFEGLVDEKLRRHGLGIYSVNNGQDYYCGQWQEDKVNGYGFHKLNYGASLFYGTFRNGILSEGYGFRALEHNFEYEGKFKDGKFHDLGSVSIRIDGVNQNEPILLVAKWANGKVASVYRNEIDENYLAQYNSFNKCLKSIADLRELDKQREYFSIFIELLEKKQLSNMLLKDINKNTRLPRELKSSADLLLRLDTAYENLGSFFSDSKLVRPKKGNYIECVREACHGGLQRYIRFLQSCAYVDESESRFLDLQKVIGSSLSDLLESNTYNMTSSGKDIFGIRDCD